MSRSSFLIAPSILSADFTCLREQIATCQAAGADWIHVDVMDGHFVPNLTMGPFIVEHLRRITDLPLDVHLMVEHPDTLLEAFARAGATYLTVHIEACADVQSTLKHIKSLGCQAGLTLNPATPPEALRSALPLADLVLVMTVHPGYAGQKFREDQLPKVRTVRQMLETIHSSAWLEVDGGVSAENIPKLKEAGANVFVAASAIFQHPQGIAAGIQAMRQALA
ncbi:MAG: ribulose-phosphate 3-epimerase [Anaerolineales bacterium]|nr:ribulose-phosphate 3-epimerase [Anaerolineales bacterium]MCX7609486.1 ribulose-phosphate 3-epimerase [Anaerolineales bacterium]MDW8227811.1 ribulose-phosphate 3-epimerase [Anaerolineales bacterium]